MSAMFDDIPPPQHRGRPCGVAALLAELNDDDGASLLRALDDPSKTSAGIGAIARANGHQIGDQAFRRHRQAQCSCGARP